MPNNANSVNRRNFLNGAGIALALPWLETFAAPTATETDTPKRFLSVYHPDGVGLPLKADPAWKDWSWFPQGGEKDFRLTKVLDVLEPLRSETNARELLGCAPAAAPQAAIFAGETHEGFANLRHP